MMHRDKFTAKIERMIGVIEAGKTLVPVHELYVFGSYRRGAIECGDLDLILVVPKVADHVYRQLGIRRGDYRAWSKICSAIHRTLCKRGERVQFEITQDVTRFVDVNGTIKPEDVLLLWSRNDRDWRAKLASITPDPSAGRFERGHFVDLKRTKSKLSAMHEALWLLREERLHLEKRSIDGVEPQLTERERRYIDHAAKLRLAGGQLLQVVPYALHWFHQEHQHISGFGWPDYSKYVSDDGTHLAHIGRISLRFAISSLFHEAQVNKACLILHLRKRSSNEMLIFSRGAKWTGNENEYRDLRLRRVS